MDKKLVLAIKDLIIEAGKIALAARQKGLVVEWKEDGSPVTNADKEISQLIFNGLSKLAPEIPVICEERPIIEIDKSQAFWLIDPIDGTKSFIKNQDSFTVNIALVDAQLAEYGFVYNPVQGVLYFTDAEKNFVIEKNGSVIDRSVHGQDGFVAVVSSSHFNSRTAEYIENNNFAEVIAIPSSLKLCLVAEGAGDVYPKFGPTMEWDIAAGHALIRAAGGEVYNQRKEPMLYAKKDFQNPHFIAANKKWILEKNN